MGQQIRKEFHSAEVYHEECSARLARPAIDIGRVSLRRKIVRHALLPQIQLALMEMPVCPRMWQYNLLHGNHIRVAIEAA